MPVHDLGYRPWSGTRSPRAVRPWVVARAGVMLVWRRRWLKLLLLIGWLPVVFPALGIFAFEYSSTDPDLRRMIRGIATGPLDRPDLAAAIEADPEQARHELWSTLILTFFRYPQLFAMVMLIGLIAPLLISYDLRTKAYLMYFSRPLSPLQYALGKSAVIWFLLGMIITVPALLVYALGVLLSPDLSVVSQTWDIPIRILAASVVLMVPTTALAVAYSSLTSESRYATFAWFATWAMGFVAYQILTSTTALVAVANNLENERREFVLDTDRWRLLSPYHTLGQVEAWVFGLAEFDSSMFLSVGILLAITIIGFWTVRRRIIARMST